MIILFYFHDLAVAVMASNIMVVYLLGRWLDKNPQKEKIMVDTFAKLSRITYIALGFIIIAGAVRAFYFMELEWNPALGRDMITALVVKHIILVSVTTWGIIVFRKYLKKYGGKN